MKCRNVTVWSASTFLAFLVGAAGCSHGEGEGRRGGRGGEKASKEVARVHISYLSKPTYELPPGLKAVAVLDSATTDDAEKKWSIMAANMIAGLVDQAARKYDFKLTVADRRNISKIMKERDLALSGLVDNVKAAQAAKLLNVEGLITSSIAVRVEKHVGKGRTITGFDSWRGPYSGGRGVETAEVEKVTRSITVQCHFQLLDAMNGKVLINQDSGVLRQTDQTKPGLFFSSSKTEAEMTPRDKIIGDLVEGEVRKFIARFMPCQVDEVIEVRASKNEACKAGIRLLAAGEYDQAIKMFDEAISANPDAKDRYAVFGQGVAYEAMGKLEPAMKAYRDAVVLDAPGAEQALQRVKTMMGAAGGEPQK
jgi:tetratricopeptide (TPR) repeat protein